jgi:hypothetical protein
LTHSEAIRQLVALGLKASTGAASRRRIGCLFAGERRRIAREQEERQSLAMTDESVDLRFLAEQGKKSLPSLPKRAPNVRIFEPSNTLWLRCLVKAPMR